MEFFNLQLQFSEKSQKVLEKATFTLHTKNPEVTRSLDNSLLTFEINATRKVQKCQEIA